jgi:transposase-like protein
VPSTQGEKAMGQILHGTATTTHATRAKIQASEASIRMIAEQHHINPKTAQKWKNRDSVDDLKCGRKPGQGSVLTDVDDAVIVETRCKTLLPLDDLYDLLKPLIPVLTRSNLHRCLQRHGVSRLVDLLPPEEKGQTKPFKKYTPGYLHIDTAQINLGKDKWYLFVAIDRATRYVYVELHDNKRMDTAAAFLRQTLTQYPFKIEKILTDNGIEFSYNLLPDGKQPKTKIHPFGKICQEQQTEHRTTLVKHPWTNGMVEAMNKKIKVNTVKRFHYDSVEALKQHLYAYILNYNFNLKLRAIGRVPPFEAMLHWYNKSPSSFTVNPTHLIVGLNT